MISSKYVSICNRSHARRVNSGKITISWGYPSLSLSFEGNLFTSATFSRNKLETLRCHTVKTRSLYLTWAWTGTGS